MPPQGPLAKLALPSYAHIIFLSGAHTPQPEHCSLSGFGMFSWACFHRTRSPWEAYSLCVTCFSQELSVLSSPWVCLPPSCHLLQSFLWRNRSVKSGLISTTVVRPPRPVAMLLTWLGPLAGAKFPKHSEWGFLGGVAHCYPACPPDMPNRKRAILSPCGTFF